MGDVISVAVCDAGGKALRKGDIVLAPCFVETVDPADQSVVIRGRTVHDVEWRVAVKATDITRFTEQDQAAVNQAHEILKRAGILKDAL